MARDKKNNGREKHGKLRGAADRMQDRAGGMIGLASAAGASDAETFVANAAIGDTYEIAAAEIALSRSHSETVRQTAVKMIDDHTTATHQLRSTLRSIANAPSPPQEPDERRTTMLEHLEAAPDEEFDRTYLEQQEMAHQENIMLFKSYLDSGDDPRLKMFAAGSLPGLERHLEMVRRAKEVAGQA